MTNDTTTLNGALSELGETMAANITTKGVSASASDGLTTLAGKILQITGGGGSTTLFEDACSSASGLSDYGSSQLVRGTNATITMSYDSTENAYKLSGSGNYHAMIPIPTLNDTDNYKISADFKAQNIQYNSVGFFLDNRNDTTSYGQAFFLNIYSKRLDGYTYKVSQDGESSHSPTVSSLSANNYYRIEMIVLGSVFVAKLYDSNLNELTSTTHTLSVENKQMGIFLFCEKGSTDSVCYVKNIKAETLGGGGSDCSQYQTKISNAIEYINGSGN